MARVHNTHDTHTLPHFLQFFCHLMQQMSHAGRGQGSGLMGKWGKGYHQANRAPQSTNQIRKLGVCVSQRGKACVCVYVCMR